MTAMRMTQLTIAAIILVGIWLTGFNNVHWLLYVPAAMLAFAGAVGFCPGAAFWAKLGFKNN